MLSENLYNLRKEKGLSQKELAALVGVSNKAVSKWETGAAIPKTETILKLAQIFNISTEELLEQVISEKEEEKPITLSWLAQNTTDILKEEQQPNENKLASDIFTPKASKVYLILVTFVFITFMLLFLFFFALFSEFLLEFFTIWEFILFSAVISFFSCSLAAGVFYFIRVFKKLSSAVLIGCVILLFMTILVLFYIGVIFSIPGIIKASSVLIKQKRSKNNGN